MKKLKLNYICAATSVLLSLGTVGFTTLAQAQITDKVVEAKSCQKEQTINNVEFIEIKINDSNKISNKMDKDVVVEFFNYACIHCSHMFPILKDSIDKNPSLKEKIVLIPASFNPMWLNGSKLYYSLLAANLDNTESHAKVYKAIHTDKLQILSNEKTLEKFLIKDFGAEKGKEIIEKYNSFDVSNKVRQATQLAAEYKISGTPSFFVENKDSKTFLVQPQRGVNQIGLLNSINDFIKLDKCSK